MHQPAITLVVVVIGIILASNGFLTVSHTASHANVLLDPCMTCLNAAAGSIDALHYVIVDRNATASCDTLSDAVTTESASTYAGALADLLCQAVGIEQFVKIFKKADLDSIRFCQVAKACPVNDNTDAKITTFSIIPASGPQGTTFGVDFTYVSVNGTGPGELLIEVTTVDRIPVSIPIIVEGRDSGTHYEFIEVTADPDPQCDPTIRPCEQWLPGTYNLTVQLCNGECGSKFPHSRIYDTAKGSFKVLG